MNKYVKNITIETPTNTKHTTTPRPEIIVIDPYIEVVIKSSLKLRDKTACWYCNQNIDPNKNHTIETSYGENIGIFCSLLCRNTFSHFISFLVPVTYKSNLCLLPFDCYADKNQIIDIINKFKKIENAGNYYGGYKSMDEGSNTVIIKKHK